MFKRSISIGVSHKPNTFPSKFFNFEILVLENGRYASPIYDEKSRLFDFEATFLEFQVIGLVPYCILCEYKTGRSIFNRPQVQKIFQVIKKFEKIEKIEMAVKFKKFVKFEKFFRF